MATIALIESMAAKLITAAFGCDYLKNQAQSAAECDSIVIADKQPENLSAKLQDSSIAAEAAEWLPVCDGRASALALSMLHVLWNDFGAYDEKFLANHTNAPFLVGEDGSYLRDEATRLPLVLDTSDRRIKTAADESLSAPSIKWSCEVRGRRARPAFELLRDALGWFAPEVVEPLTGVPAGTLRRIALQAGSADCHISAALPAFDLR